MPWIVHAGYTTALLKDGEEVFKWLVNRILNNDVQAIEEFIVYNDINKISCPPGTSTLLDALYQIDIRSKKFPFNLLELAAAESNQATFDAVTKLYTLVKKLPPQKLYIEKYSILHIAILNLNNPEVVRTIIKTCPEAANQYTKKLHQLPLEYAWQNDNKEVLEDLYKATDPKLLKNLKLELGENVSSKTRIQNLIIRLTKIKDSLFIVSTNKEGLHQIQKVDNPECEIYINILQNRLSDNFMLATTTANNTTLATIEDYLKKTESDLSEERQIEFNVGQIEKILTDLANYLGLPNNATNAEIKNKLRDYNYNGMLLVDLKNSISFSSEAESFRYLNILLTDINSFKSCIKDIAESASITLSPDKIPQIIAINNKFLLFKQKMEDLQGLPYAANTSIKDLGKHANLHEMENNIERWNNFYNKIWGIHLTFHMELQRKDLIKALPSNMNLEQAEQILEEKEKILQLNRAMRKKHPDLFHKLSSLINRIVNHGKKDKQEQYTHDEYLMLQDAEKLALEVMSLDQPEDAVFFINEINEGCKIKNLLYCNHLSALCNVLRDTIELKTLLAKQLSQESRQFSLNVKNKIELKQNGNQIQFINHSLEELACVEKFKEISKALKEKIKEQTKKLQTVNNKIDSEIIALYTLVSRFRSLKGVSEGEYDKIDEYLKVEGKPLEEYYQNVKHQLHTSILLDIQERKYKVEREIKDTIAIIESKRRFIEFMIREGKLLFSKLKFMSTKDLNKKEWYADVLSETFTWIHTKIVDLDKASLSDLEDKIKERQKGLEQIKKYFEQSQEYLQDLLRDLDDIAQKTKGQVQEYLSEMANLNGYYENKELKPSIKTVIYDFLGSYLLPNGFLDTDDSADKKFSLDVERFIESIHARDEEYKQQKKAIECTNNLRNEVLAKLLQEINKEINSLNDLKSILEFPNDSQHYYDQITNLLKDLVQQGKIKYASQEEKQEDDSNTISQIEAPLLKIHSVEEIAELPVRYQKLITKLSDLPAKLKNKRQEIISAEHQAKAKLQKKDKLSLELAIQSLKKPIDTFNELMQKINATGVDPMCIELMVHTVRIKDLIGKQNLNLITEHDLENLEKLYKVNNYVAYLQEAIQEASQVLIKSVRMQLEKKVGKYNEQMTALYDEIKEPFSTISSACQNSARVFTTSIKQPNFTKHCGPIDPIIEELCNKELKSFNKSWQLIEQTYGDALIAIRNEKTKVKSDYENYKTAIVSFQQLLAQFKANDDAYQALLSESGEVTDNLKNIKNKYEQTYNCFVKLLLIEGDNTVQSLSVEKVNAKFKINGFSSLMQLDNEAKLLLNNLIELKNKVEIYKNDTTNAKRIEYQSLQKVINRYKLQLVEWQNKNHLKLDNDKLASLLKDIDSFNQISRESYPNELLFHTDQIQKLKNLESRITEFNVTANTLEIRHLQRLAKLDQSLPQLKKDIELYNSLKSFSLTPEEQETIRKVDILLDKVYTILSPNVNLTDRNKSEDELDQIDGHLIELKSTLGIIIPLLTRNKNKAQLDEKAQLDNLQEDLKECFIQLQHFVKLLLFLNHKIDATFLLNSLPACLTHIRTLPELSTFKINSIVRTEKSIEAISENIESINKFKSSLEVVISNEYKRLIDDLNEQYQIAVSQYNSIKDHPNANKVVDECKELDRALNEKIHQLGLCLVSILNRKEFDPLIKDLFLLDKYTESNFTQLISNLKLLIKSHKNTIINKIDQFKTNESTQLELAKSNYERELNKLKNLQTKYLQIQGKLLKADKKRPVVLQQWIDEIIQTEKCKVADYDKAFKNISAEMKKLDLEIKSSLKTLITEGMQPYNDALTKIPLNDRKDCHVPEAVKNLAKLLSLNVPKNLCILSASEEVLILKSDKEFNYFINNFSVYVKKAADSVGDEHNRLIQEAEQATKKAEEEFRKRKEQKEQEKLEKELKKAQKAEEERRQVEKNLREQEAKLQAQAQKLKDEEEKRKLIEKAQKDKEEREQIEKERKEKERKEKERKELENQKQEQQPQQQQQKNVEEEKLLTNVPATQKSNTQEQEKRLDVKTEAEKKKNLKTQKLSKENQNLNAQIGKEIQQKQSEKPMQDQDKKSQGKKSRTKKKEVPGLKTEPPKEQQTLPPQEPIASDQHQVVRTNNKPTSKQDIKSKELHNKVKAYLSDLQTILQAQIDFNRDSTALGRVQRDLVLAIEKTQLKNDNVLFFENEDILRQLASIDYALSAAINNHSDLASLEGFSFKRFFKVLLGIGTNVVVNNPKQEQTVVIKHSNTIKFLSDLSRYHKEKLEELRRQLNFSTSHFGMNRTFNPKKTDEEASKVVVNEISESPASIPYDSKKYQRQAQRNITNSTAQAPTFFNQPDTKTMNRAIQAKHGVTPLQPAKQKPLFDPKTLK